LHSWRRSIRKGLRQNRRSKQTGCLEIGQALGSPVSLDYHERAPFKFNGTIEKINIKYI